MSFWLNSRLMHWLEAVPSRRIMLRANNMSRARLENRLTSVISLISCVRLCVCQRTSYFPRAPQRPHSLAAISGANYWDFDACGQIFFFVAFQMMMSNTRKILFFKKLSFFLNFLHFSVSFQILPVRLPQVNQLWKNGKQLSQRLWTCVTNFILH